MAMSASMNCTPWNRATGSPNCSRRRRDAERLRGDRDPGVVEGGEGGLEPGSLRADHAVGRDARVLEDDGAGRRALDPELLLRRAEADPRIGLLHHKRRNPAGTLRRV